VCCTDLRGKKGTAQCWPGPRVEGLGPTVRLLTWTEGSTDSMSDDASALNKALLRHCPLQLYTLPGQTDTVVREAAPRCV
jgi:hypothetical protein